MSKTSITLEQFRALMLAAGYEEVLERSWAPSTVLAVHTHPFEANALVVQGEMWLTIEDREPRQLRPGDVFHVRAHVAHAETYSEAGATYWVARRNVVPPGNTR